MIYPLAYIKTQVLTGKSWIIQTKFTVEQFMEKGNFFSLMAIPTKESFFMVCFMGKVHLPEIQVLPTLEISLVIEYQEKEDMIDLIPPDMMGM